MARAPDPAKRAQKSREDEHDENSSLFVTKEELKVDTRQVQTGSIRVEKKVHEQELVVDEPLIKQSVDIKRVPINTFVEEAHKPRQEGSTTIIPIYEEVLVVEKRLKLKEEIHITREQNIERDPQTVTVREEEAVVHKQD